MPTTGTKLYRFVDEGWRRVYAELFDDGEKASIRAAFDRALSEAGLADERIWGGSRIAEARLHFPASARMRRWRRRGDRIPANSWNHLRK